MCLILNRGPENLTFLYGIWCKQHFTEMSPDFLSFHACNRWVQKYVRSLPVFSIIVWTDISWLNGEITQMNDKVQWWSERVKAMTLNERGDGCMVRMWDERRGAAWLWHSDVGSWVMGRRRMKKKRRRRQRRQEAERDCTCGACKAGHEGHPGITWCDILTLTEKQRLVLYLTS